MSVILRSTHDISKLIAKQVKEQRLSINLSQKTLSALSGVSYSTLKKFERTGQISLESLLMIALALGCLDRFEKLFSKDHQEVPTSLDALLKDETRQRGRR